MSSDVPPLYFFLGGLAVVLLLGWFYARQFQVKSRIRRYTGGSLPETMNLGAVYYGLSTETGRFRKREGAIFATRTNLVFLKQSPGTEIVEIPWHRIISWEAVGAFRERPLERKIISVVVDSEVGAPVAHGFAIPRPEFWTAFIDVAIKSPKNPETS